MSSGDDGERADDDHEAEGLDRRSSERFHVVWSVDCETEDTFLYAKITNVSEMGIFVYTTEPLAIGTRLSLRFSPSHVAIGAFELEGQVQWINPARPSCPNPGMGVLLVLTPDDRERLVEVIRTIAYLPEHAAAN